MAQTGHRLKTYREKRDFEQTPEPKGRVSTKKGHLYIIQKHAARRLHYDFRLELDGVLLSWAVTKGPSLNPADKRLAVRTEDHPLEYGGFEGVIPKGYGAGTVMLWDRGEWMPQGDPHEGLEKGELKITLAGERLRGGFVLVRMKNNPKEKRENWLLIKERDDTADDDFIATEAWQDSIKTGRDLDAISRKGEGYEKGKTYSPEVEQAGSSKQSSRKPSKSKGGAKPAFVAPQLAQLQDAPPEGPDWLHEIKYDGYRIIALIENGKVQLITRNEHDWTERYPPIAGALAKLDVESAVLDGELVALDPEGRSNFGLLGRYGEAGGRLVYYLFDLLHLDGEDLKKVPLAARKERLSRLLEGVSDPLRYSDHIAGDGTHVIATACKMNLEGIVSKNGKAPYRSGRGTSWIKSKCIGRDEFVIGGYRKSDKRGRPFASLLLGEYVDGELHYRGRVGTGFDETVFSELGARLEKLTQKANPFVETPAEARRGVVWVKPEIVAEIAYSERTSDERLRHPSFMGVREDKPVEAVSAPPRTPARPQTTGDRISGVKLTHPDKAMYTEPEVSKRLIAEYYARHAERILPFLADRPLSLLRCPDGSDGECFFQKHHTGSIPREIEPVEIAEKAGKKAPYLVIRAAAGLVAATQIGALELHLWGARTDQIEKPERIVFDLDPDAGMDFARVKDAARDVQARLADLGLESFPLLTGGKGLHVIAPITRRREWPEVKAFCRGFAHKMAEEDKQAYIATASKAKRKDRIFIDWLRNERGSTAISPYSLRARKGAPVATPIAWGELDDITSGAQFTVGDMDARLDGADPWPGYGDLRQSITKRALEAVS